MNLVKRTVLEQIANLNPTIKNLYYIGPVQRADIEEVVDYIITQCVQQCEQAAQDAEVLSKSEPEPVRQLYQGMWGGAKICALDISQHFYEVQQ